MNVYKNLQFQRKVQYEFRVPLYDRDKRACGGVTNA
jgi:hypothetical protein